MFLRLFCKHHQAEPKNIKRNTNLYAVQQDTQSVLMSEFIHHVC